MSKQRRTFSPEFKRQAACLVLDQGYSHVEASRSIGVGESLMRRWVPHLLETLVLIEQIKVALKTIERFDATIARLAPTLPDFELFSDLPGAGPTLAPRLPVAFGE